MNIKQALFYPYQKGHFSRSVGIPVALSILMSVVFLAGFLGLALTSLSVEQLAGLKDDPMALVNAFGGLLPGLGVGILLMLPFALALHGYYWNLAATWQTEGLDADPPAWKGNFKAYMVDGFHAMLAWVVLFIPVMLGYVTLGFLMPFAFAPYLEAAQERRIGAVLRTLPQAMGQAKNQYGALLGGMWMCILLAIPVGIIMGVLQMTVIGGMLVQMAFTVTCLYLMTQQYGASGAPTYHPRSGKPAPSSESAFSSAPAAVVFGAQPAPAMSQQPTSEVAFTMDFDDSPSTEANDPDDNLTYAPGDTSSPETDSAEDDLNSRWMSEAPAEFTAQDNLEPQAEAKTKKTKDKAPKPSMKKMKMLKLQPGDNPWLRHQSRM